MRFKPLLIFCLIPLLAALGHDSYLYYENLNDGFRLTKVGFLMFRYIPDEFNEFRTMVDAKTWKILVTYIFDQLTVLVAAVPLALAFIISLGFTLFGNKDD